ncbi:DsrE family protein [Acidiferrobacter sp.]|jgi:peroxiredoxin family protein|uniref:DsrE family protein n=1 Tax=Acidiferrobacter sp. TaxID=1872107 RepID=UPI00262A1822|nr:DsrE family protein [Acidiferrobacter sp.]
MSDRICIIMTSGTREKLQMAAMTAAVASAGGTDVGIFVSMNALPYFRREGAPEAPAEGDVGHALKARNAPRFLDLFAQAVDLGSARIYPCSMALDVLSLGPADLVSYLEKPTGLTKFLSELEGSHVLTF